MQHIKFKVNVANNIAKNINKNTILIREGDLILGWANKIGYHKYSAQSIHGDYFEGNYKSAYNFLVNTHKKLGKIYKQINLEKTKGLPDARQIRY
jgi:hypothetical protein